MTPSPSQSSESGNDEAATAVLMSLLEVNEEGDCSRYESEVKEGVTAALMSLLEVNEGRGDFSPHESSCK